MAVRGQVHEVLYAFDAEGAEELSVTGGQRVTVVPGGDQGDGWTLVETLDGNKASGFVPTQFIRPVAGETALVSPQTLAPAGSPAGSPGQALALAPAPAPTQAPLSDTAASHAVTAASTLLAPPVGGGLAATEEFSHLFATHEVWYKQASERRAATFGALNDAVTGLAAQAAESESKTAGLLDRIAELDGLIEDERAKWEEKLKEEQAALAAGTALLTDISAGAAGNA